MEDQRLLQSLDPRDPIERNVKPEEEEVSVRTKEEEIPLQISPDHGDIIERYVKSEEEEEEEVSVRNREEIPLQISPGSSIPKMSKANIRDVEEFIQMVKDHPIVYDPRHPDYYKKDKRDRVWLYLASQIIIHWDYLEEVQQDQQLAALKTRWTSLHDSFIRQLKSNAMEKSGAPASKRRKTYRYFKVLSFLKESVEMRSTSTNLPVISSQENSCSDSDLVAGPSGQFSEGPDSDAQPGPSHAPAVSHQTHRRESSRPPEVVQELASLQDISHELVTFIKGLHQNVVAENDEDMLFAKMLVPALRVVPAPHKFDLHCEILQVVKRYRLLFGNVEFGDQVFPTPPSST